MSRDEAKKAAWAAIERQQSSHVGHSASKINFLEKEAALILRCSCGVKFYVPETAMIRAGAALT